MVTGPPPLFTLYIHSFHWALAQFTPAPNNFHPTNTRERTYATGALFVGFLTFASFLASITATVTALRKKNADGVRKEEMIRRYLEENDVPLALGDRITSFLRTQKDRKAHVLESQIPSFASLPESLLKLLHYEVYAKILVRHPLFFHVREVKDKYLKDVCHRVASTQSFKKGTEIFSFGQHAHSMWFILTGWLEYFVGEAEDTSTRVEAGSWICEAALWLKWTHKGRLEVCEFVECVALDAERFRSLGLTRGIGEAFKAYAQAFAARAITATDEVACGLDQVQEMVHQSFDAEVSTPVQEMVHQSFEAEVSTRDITKVLTDTHQPKDLACI